MHDQEYELTCVFCNRCGKIVPWGQSSDFDIGLSTVKVERDEEEDDTTKTSCVLSGLTVCDDCVNEFTPIAERFWAEVQKWWSKGTDLVPSA